MDNKFSRLATYLATFCVNLAVIGAGLALFEGKGETVGLSALTLVLGAFITWRAIK